MTDYKLSADAQLSYFTKSVGLAPVQSALGAVGVCNEIS